MKTDEKIKTDVETFEGLSAPFFCYEGSIYEIVPQSNRFFVARSKIDEHLALDLMFVSWRGYHCSEVSCLISGHDLRLKRLVTKE